jgi:hypothetical protein
VAFADPQSITVNAVAQSLARTGTGLGTGTFRTNDGNFSLEVAHRTGRRGQHTIAFKQRKIAADPLASANNVEYTMTARVTFDVPLVGYTVAEQKLLWDGFVTWLTASSGAKVTQLLGGEN